MTATSATKFRRVMPRLQAEEFDALAQVARSEERTPDQQATYLLRRAMRETGIYPSPSLRAPASERDQG